MKSIIVHYSGDRARRARTGRGSCRGSCGTSARRRPISTSAQVRALQGRIEVVLGADADWAAVRDRLREGVRRRRTSPAPGARRSTSTPSRPRSCAIWDRRPSILPRLGAARGQALPLDLAADRARGRRPNQGSARLARRPRRRRTDDPRRDADRTRRSTSSASTRARAACRSASSGRVACLLSGGIDSPVAAWRLMRRGCRVLFVHFHSYPILSRASQEKARELVRAADARSRTDRGSSSCRSAKSSSRSCCP